MEEERTNIFLQGALVLKSILKEKRKNCTVCMIVVLLSFSSCIGFVLYQNFSIEQDKLLELIGAETGNVIVEGKNLQPLAEEISAWEEVESVSYYSNCSAKLSKGEESATLTIDFWKTPEALKYETLLVGRLPKYENEIVITAKVSEVLNAQVGDVIYVEGVGERKDYFVCGIDQKMNNMGMKALMNYKGAERLNGFCTTYYLYIYTKKDVAYAQIETLLSENYENIIIMDSKSRIENMIVSISVGMKTICVVFVVITVFVVSMVVMLLVKTKISQEKRNYGIYKALGFTTRQLILQMLCANLPLMLAGAVLGAILSAYLADFYGSRN